MTMWTVWFSAAFAVFTGVILETSGSGTQIRRSVAVLPHDTYPGFSVKKFEVDTGGRINFRMLETGFNQFFTVLDNGVVMTTSDLSPLVNRPINLVVLEESPNKTSTHSLHLYVLDRRDMLSFKQDMYEGEISENMPAGSTVSGLPLLKAVGGGVGGLPVRYSIISGNEDGAFRLKPASNSSGVLLVTELPLDHEKESERLLTVQASDGRGIDKAVTKIRVNILDENDNSPIFKQHVYRFTIDLDKENALINSTMKRFRVVGSVSATDADNDKVAYRLLTPSNIAVIVPQTGDILLIGEPATNAGEDTELELKIEAHDLRTPSRESEVPARVWLQFNTPILGDNHLQALEESARRTKHREKRRVTRAVRPTKRIEFTEGDGEIEGRIVFQLEKETERETFKIRDENAWVTVEPNGAVRVKKKWDYEELGPEKTIDFWVTITNNGNGGEIYYLIFFSM